MTKYNIWYGYLSDSPQQNIFLFMKECHLDAVYVIKTEDKCYDEKEKEDSWYCHNSWKDEPHELKHNRDKINKYSFRLCISPEYLINIDSKLSMPKSWYTLDDKIENIEN